MLLNKAELGVARATEMVLQVEVCVASMSESPRPCKITLIRRRGDGRGAGHWQVATHQFRKVARPGLAFCSAFVS